MELFASGHLDDSKYSTGRHTNHKDQKESSVKARMSSGIENGQENEPASTNKRPQYSKGSKNALSLTHIRNQSVVGRV